MEVADGNQCHNNPGPGKGYGTLCIQCRACFPAAGNCGDNAEENAEDNPAVEEFADQNNRDAVSGADGKAYYCGEDCIGTGCKKHQHRAEQYG